MGVAHTQIPLLYTGLSPDSLPGLPAAHPDPSSARSQVEPRDPPLPSIPHCVQSTYLLLWTSVGSCWAKKGLSLGEERK